MDALKNLARAARLLSLVIFDVVRPSRPEYRLPARWLGASLLSPERRRRC